jgi:Zn-dependent protease/CBS domain-containing protein
MRSWSISFGQWFGVNVRLHLSFLFLLVYVWLTQSPHHDPSWALARSFAFTLIVLAAVVLHELAHMAATLREGSLPRALILLPLGGVPVAEISASALEERRDAGRETRIALAGPIVNLLLAVLIAISLTAFVPQILLWNRPLLNITNLARCAVWINIFIAALNLLPAYPLDVGRVLRASLAGRMDPVSATRRAAGLGNLFVIALMFAGLLNTWFMLAGFFLFIAAQLEERTFLFYSVLESVRMEEIMLTDFSTLSPADTLEDALSKAVHTLQDDFPVLRGADMVGVVSRQKILRALRGGENAYVQSIMERAYETAALQDSLASAFRKITRQGLTIIPVLDQERLVGIVTLQNLMHSMSVLAESRKLRRSREEEI